jgi:hypothetical protein
LTEIISTSGNSLLETFSLQSKPNYASMSKEQVLKSMEVKEKLVYCYDQLYETVKEANLSLPQEMVESIIVDAIISRDEKKT